MLCREQEANLLRALLIIQYLRQHDRRILLLEIAKQKTGIANCLRITPPDQWLIGLLKGWRISLCRILTLKTFVGSPTASVTSRGGSRSRGWMLSRRELIVSVRNITGCSTRRRSCLKKKATLLAVRMHDVIRAAFRRV